MPAENEHHRSNRAQYPDGGSEHNDSQDDTAFRRCSQVHIELLGKLHGSQEHQIQEHRHGCVERCNEILKGSGKTVPCEVRSNDHGECDSQPEFELRIDATCHNIIEENEFLIVEFVTHA